MLFLDTFWSFNQDQCLFHYADYAPFIFFFPPFQLFLTLKRTKLVKAIQLKLKCVDQVYFQGSILLNLQAESLCGTNTVTFSLNLSPI